MASIVAPWDTPTLGVHPIDAWLAAQDEAAWHYVSPGHLVGPDFKPEDDFDRLLDFDTWIRKVRADLKGRCRQPQNGRSRPRHGFG